MLDLLDPSAAIVVAEVEAGKETTSPVRGNDINEARKGSGMDAEEDGREIGEVEAQSQRMLQWVTSQGGLSQTSSSGKVVVGFAIWNLRKGHAAQQPEANKSAASAVSWETSLRGI